MNTPLAIVVSILGAAIIMIVLRGVRTYRAIKRLFDNTGSTSDEKEVVNLLMRNGWNRGIAEQFVNDVKAEPTLTAQDKH